MVPLIISSIYTLYSGYLFAMSPDISGTPNPHVQGSNRSRFFGNGHDALKGILTGMSISLSKWWIYCKRELS